MSHHWLRPIDLPPASFKCPYCSQIVGSSTGYQTYNVSNAARPFNAYVCGSCRGIILIDTQQRPWPEAVGGNPVQHLPNDVEELYEEARGCMSVSAYTAVALACRKLLMSTAVSKGADADKTFQYYINFLLEKAYLPPDARPWVDHIRSKGNEATHQIPHTTKDDATELLVMTESLLRMVYELPALVNARLPAVDPPELSTS